MARGARLMLILLLWNAHQPSLANVFETHERRELEVALTNPPPSPPQNYRCTLYFGDEVSSPTSISGAVYATGLGTGPVTSADESSPGQCFAAHPMPPANSLLIKEAQFKSPVVL